MVAPKGGTPSHRVDLALDEANLAEHPDHALMEHGDGERASEEAEPKSRANDGVPGRALAIGMSPSHNL